MRTGPARAAILTALLAGLLPAVSAPAASANSNFRSVIDRIAPPQPGLTVQVLGFDQNLQAVNRTGKDVLIRGYENEPYAQILADGTVQVNENSPARYLNEDRYGSVKVPPTAGPDKPVAWQTLDRSGRFTWHDHRMHWMSSSPPPAVTDSSKRTKIYAYKVPIEVGGQAAAIHGTLFWVGRAGGGMPAWAIATLVLAALAAVIAVVAARRRRGAPAAGDHLP